MRDQLDPLPDNKQRELADVVRILFEEFDASKAHATKPWKKAGRILKLVLCGSYARGDWVDDPIGGYTSDYDILVVVSDERLTDIVDYWATAEDRLMRDMTIAKTLSAPVNFVVHSLMDVNTQISRGRPFFTDVVKQGVMLYEAEGHPFATPGQLPPEEARAEAQTHFDRWFESAGRYLDTGVSHTSKGWFNEAAFELHQATERFYHCILLVLTLYSERPPRGGPA